MASQKRFVVKHGLDANNFTIVNVAAPVNAGDVTTKGYVDTALAGVSGVSLSGNNTFTGTNDFTGGTISVPTPSSSSNAASKGYVDTALAGYQLLDADLTAIAALTGTSGLLRKTATNTWSLDTASYLTGNESIAISGDASGTGTTAITLTLASVGTPVTGSFAKITTDAKGRVTATSSVGSSDITTALGYTPVNEAGDVMSGALTLDLNAASVTDSLILTNSSMNATTGRGARIVFAGSTSGSFAGNTAAIRATNVSSSNNNGQLEFQTSNAGTLATHVTIDHVGNVGIATSAPSQPLEVAGVVFSSSGGFMFPDATTQTTAWTGNQNISVTGDATGSGATSIALTLATVNSNTGSFGTASSVGTFVVNGKGLITSASNTSISIAASQVSSGTFADARIAQSNVTQHQSALTIAESQITNGSLLARVGDNETITGTWTFNNPVTGTTPTAATHLATKQYVDDIASGVNVHNACEVATTTALASCTYNNGSSGVGATLTATTNGALGTVGGYAGLIVGSRVLVKDQSTQLQNGIYVVTDLGSGSTPWILTRSSDADGSPTTEIEAGDMVYIQEGTLGGTQWIQTSVGTGHSSSPAYDYVIVGTDAVVFTQFSGSGTITGGTGITVTGNSVAITNVGTAGTYTAVTTNAQGQVSSGTNLTATGDVTGTASGSSIALSLPSVGTPVTSSFVKITTDAKGRVSGTSAVAASDITSLVDATYVNVSGDTMTGTLNLPSNGLVVGSTQLVVSGGSVGVGTNAPGAQLDVRGTTSRLLNSGSSDTAMTVTNSVTSISMGSDATSPYISVAGAYPLRVLTNSSEAARVLSNGRILVNTTTDNGTDQLQVNGSVSATSHTLANGGQTSVTLTTSSTTANQVVDAVSTTAARVVEYLIQVSSGSAYQGTKLLVVHDGTNTVATEYGTVVTGSNLATFNTTISAGNMQLRVTPVNAVTTIKVIRTTVNV